MAFKDKEVNEEIDHNMLKSFLLLRTVITAICNMGERALPTGQVLSKVGEHKRRGVEVDRETPRSKDTDVQDHQKGIRGEKWRMKLTESVKGQLTESAGRVDVDDNFSWYRDFNRGSWREDGSSTQTYALFSLQLVYSAKKLTRYKVMIYRKVCC